MPQFATADELAQLLEIGDTMPGPQAGRANLLLRLASAAVARFARQSFVLVEDDVIELVPQQEPHQLWLPERPVLEVPSITLDGLPLTGYEFNRMGRIRWRLASFTQRRTVGAGFYPPSIIVTYTHGYALDASEIPDPNDLGITLLPDEPKSVALTCAARTWDNPAGLLAETKGTYSVTYGGTDGSALGMDKGLTLTLTRSEKGLIKPWRRTTASVTLGGDLAGLTAGVLDVDDDQLP